ncbi:MAG: S-adenosylmethionine:tRNA ribosyltransferase-isomerase [Muribaculaceae bacterium]|nr:S-adenosylmethionine:tRNA ribosyltransferase-isomerase [Muribaculaceae bacterium]
MKLEDIKDIRIEDFDYPLPDERIAKHPLADRDSCKLLVDADGITSHHTFRELPDLLPAGSLLVMNNTRVINARMEFFRASGARIEIFLLEPLDPRDYAVAFQTRSRCSWQCLVGNLKKWKDDYLEKSLDINGKQITLRATRHESLPGNAHAIEFSWTDPSVTFASIVEAAGNIPIPPYLNRKSEDSDSTDYQTVYSRIEGSVAAPTAGLHFTPELLDKIRDRGIETREVTLHVGAGTFQPVKSEEIGSHPMHRETFEISLDLVRSLRHALESGRKIIAVGTTTVRTLESLPLLGIHLSTINDQLSTDNGEWTSDDEKRTKYNEITQWEAYTDEALSIDTVEALRALEQYMEKDGTDHLSASTSIMIAPGFRWRIVDGMVTNFHQPQSTLLLLVSSLLDGDNLDNPKWQRIYKEALDHDYRFLSYGDACLFIKPWAL